jgi:hypothetical protein
MEHGLQHHRALNRGVRVDPGCAGSAAQFRISPPRDGGFIEPERQSSSLDESSIVLGTISDTILKNVIIFYREPIVLTQQLFRKSVTMPP